MGLERERQTRWGKRICGVVFATLSVASVLPILHSRLLPMVDFPAHAGQVALWQALAGSPELQAHYTLHPSSPYVMLYFLWRALTLPGLSVPDAGRAVLALSVLALPLSLVLLMHARRRPWEWSLLVFLSLYTHSLAWGFLPFFLSISVFLLATAVFQVWLDRGGLGWGIAAATGGLLVLWSHALTAGFWGITVGILAVFRHVPLRTRLLGLLPTAPTGLYLLGWLITSLGHNSGHSPFGGVLDRERQLVPYLVGFFTRDVREAAQPLVWLIAAGPLLALIACRVHSASWLEAAGMWWRGFDRPMLLASLAAITLYFVVPADMLLAANVNARFATFTFLLLLASYPPLDWLPGRAVFSSATLVVALTVLVRLDRAFASFNRDVGDVNALFQRLPHNANIELPRGAMDRVPPFILPVLSHFASWAQVWTLGAADGFTHTPQMLVRESPANPAPWPAAVLVTESGGPTGIRSSSDGPLPDYVLLFSEEKLPASLPVVDGPFRYEFFGKSGNLTLYERKDGATSG